jgi:hypothetical protein
MTAENRETPLGKPHLAFLGFVEAVQEEGDRKDFINASNAPEVASYWRFWSLDSNWKESMEKPTNHSGMNNNGSEWENGWGSALQGA